MKSLGLHQSLGLYQKGSGPGLDQKTGQGLDQKISAPARPSAVPPGQRSAGPQPRASRGVSVELAGPVVSKCQA